jgi:hypothetical protein
MKISKRRVNRSHLFCYAWIIAKMGASIYGDNPSDYFNSSLKLAWGKMQSMDTYRLIKVLSKPYRPRGKKEIPVLKNQLRLPFKEQYIKGAS